MNRNRVLALAAVASTILLTSAAARAQSLHEAAAPPASTASPEQAPTVTLRAEVLSGLALFTPATWFDGMAELVGGSASLRLLDLVEGEVGLGFWANPCGGSLSPVARLGVSPSVLSPSPSGTRWNLRIPLLVDYNYLRIDGSGCDARPDWRIHSLRGATGLDATFWGSRRLGFNLRALGFAGLARETTSPCSDCAPGPETVSDHFAFGATLSVGLALRVF